MYQYFDLAELTVCLTKPIYIFGIEHFISVSFLEKIEVNDQSSDFYIENKLEYFTTCTEGNMDQVNYNGKDPRIDP